MNTKKLLLKTNEEILNILGPQDAYLRDLERDLKVSVFVHHHEQTETAELSIKGRNSAVDKAINKIKDRLNTYYNLRLAGPAEKPEPEKEETLPENAIYRTDYAQHIYPRTPNQKKYVKAISISDITVAVGPAGTGKTYLASAMALAALKSGKVKRIILTRPIVESGEKLGFLPGAISEKVHPYLKPLYDSFYHLLGPEKFRMYREEETIETVPLAYMRGRTLENAFIILDEAQNSTTEQMKMFLTRMGVFSKIVITGDVTQIDLKEKSSSGLLAAVEIIKKIPEIKFVYFDKGDVVRHPVVAKIIQAYENWEKRKK